MSTELKTANLASTILTNKIVVDTKLDQTAVVDVTQGPGTLYAIEVDATATNAGGHQYLKLKLTTADVTVGTTKRFVTCFPGGLPYTSLTAWLTSSEADNATTNSEAAAQRNTIVRFVTS